MKQLPSSYVGLMDILKYSLLNKNDIENKVILNDSDVIDKILTSAEKHAVLPLIMLGLENIQSDFYDRIHFRVNEAARKTSLQTYKLLYLTNRIVKILEAEAISVIVLKGIVTANLYPIPELRKSGDIDLLLPKVSEINKACDILEKNGFIVCGNKNDNHHVSVKSNDGIIIELHIKLVEPFDSKQVNEYLDKLILEYKENIQYVDVIGSYLPVPTEAYHGFHLLLHMLQHYLRAGFGLKLLCDWVVFWNRNIDQFYKDEFIKMVDNVGLWGFAQQVTKICIKYLGLKSENVIFLSCGDLNDDGIDELLYEILVAEEFGKSSNDRLVVLRSNSIFDYIREFHHQMQLTYPKHSKYIIFWPVLWSIVMYRFLRNNRKVRNTTIWSVLKRVRERSKLSSKLELFQVNRKK